MFRSYLSKSVLVVLGLVAVVAITAPDADATTHWIRAQVNEPFEVNGRLFQPGELSVQQVSEYNPTLSLNKICVDGECLGLLLAEISPAEAVSDEHSLFFDRDPDGHLVLVGYTYRDASEAQRLYEFRVEDSSLMLSRAGTDTARHPSLL